MKQAKKNPYRMIGIVFSSIAAVEVIVAVCLLAVNLRATAIIALPFALQSLIFGGIGAGFLISYHRKTIRRERLLSNGYYETATVIAIQQNSYVRVNHQHPYHVICRITRDGVIHEYRSEGFCHHPGLNPGDPVSVYLDRQDEKNYYVDVESAAPTIIRH